MKNLILILLFNCIISFFSFGFENQSITQKRMNTFVSNATHYQLYNMLGVLIYEGNMIDFKSLQKGIYILVYWKDNQKITEKFIIE